MDKLLGGGQQRGALMALSLVGDGVEEVRLAKARRAEEDKGVVLAGGVVGDVCGGGVGELCVVADDKLVKCQLRIGPRADGVGAAAA